MNATAALRRSIDRVRSGSGPRLDDRGRLAIVTPIFLQQRLGSVLA
jgi:hypothetical protein